jgi:hypothetical protein
MKKKTLAKQLAQKQYDAAVKDYEPKFRRVKYLLYTLDSMFLPQVLNDKTKYYPDHILIDGELIKTKTEQAIPNLNNQYEQALSKYNQYITENNIKIPELEIDYQNLMYRYINENLTYSKHDFRNNSTITYSVDDSFIGTAMQYFIDSYFFKQQLYYFENGVRIKQEYDDAYKTLDEATKRLNELAQSNE